MGHASVLVLDDEAMLRATLVEFLTSQGYEPSCARDSRSGLELATIHTPDVILLDIDMPRVSGLDAIPALQAAAPGARIIVITGRASDDLARQTLARGAFDFIAKPLDYEVLRRSLAAALAPAARRA